MGGIWYVGKLDNTITERNSRTAGIVPDDGSSRDPRMWSYRIQYFFGLWEYYYELDGLEGVKFMGFFGLHKVDVGNLHR